MAYTASHFARDRKEWVKELEYFNKVWEKLTISRSNHWQRKQALLIRIESKLATLLPTDAEKGTGTCFAEKVRQILDSIRIANEDAILRGEILKMLVPAIGRLMIPGGPDSDTFAMKMDQKVERLDKEWQEKSPKKGEIEDFRQAQLRSRWTSLSVVSPICLCPQCVKRR
ncbi:hypothetical protein N7532_002068 [Penicillium argentinense]|uniref:Uncharacterized protein n=1 Tax=Penicillium argentinense TaxID=1131581 RepID=A0A9W9G3V0_9EURO|nr:uncharacterized protein N7532_002068 [Penicillium argentinense]KAJ5111533.1 hypothetical protein N7532_002068 [Penicillium argentinense]